MKTSPMQRSLKHLRDAGWTCAIVEHWNLHAKIRQDLFGFGELVRPEWRMSLGYEFLTRLWLLGGAEDVLAVQDRDYFVGLQLRFNDRDLKSLLPFAPSVK